jgi:hypothetical protein
MIYSKAIISRFDQDTTYFNNGRPDQTCQGASMLKKIIQSILVCFLLAGCMSGNSLPQPGAKFSGTINISQQKAKTGEILFNISRDGTKISDITLRFTDVLCEGVSTDTVNLNVIVDSPLDGTRFTVDSAYFGEISGTFQSSTTAGGDINVILGKNFTKTHTSCNLGTYLWSASAESN